MTGFADFVNEIVWFMAFLMVWITFKWCSHFMLSNPSYEINKKKYANVTFPNNIFTQVPFKNMNQYFIS